MNFSKEEIILAKELNKLRVKKEIKPGDWFLSESAKKPILCAYSNKGWHLRNDMDIIPLWQIHDCLEWLKERYDSVDLGSIDDEWDAQVYDAYDKVHHPKFLEDIRGKTPLEALLKAMLLIVKEN